MIALYQNGERLMPANGYPMRLLLPGWEGNMSIKWLRRIQVTDTPGMTFPESKTYTQLLPGGKAYQFYFIEEVKSFITRPSPGLAMNGPGYYEISGLAYSGEGCIKRVLVSADAGNVQPTRAEFVAHRGELKEPLPPTAFPNQHFNAITSWAIDTQGEVKHVYA